MVISLYSISINMVTVHSSPHLCLILEILSDLSSGEIPHLDEPISAARDQVLTIGGERCTLRIRLASKLDRLVQKSRVLLLLQIPHCSTTSEREKKNWIRKRTQQDIITDYRLYQLTLLLRSLSLSSPPPLSLSFSPLPLSLSLSLSLFLLLSPKQINGSPRW